MKAIITSFILICVFGFSFCQSLDDVKIEVTQLSDNLYMLQGTGGNMAVMTGEDGTVLIDDQFAPLSEKILSVIETLSENDLKYVINTHWHGDHTGGNENMHDAGATIVAHKNVKERLSKDQLMKAFSRKVDAQPAKAWPSITFSDELSIEINGESVHLIHVHNAHTDGDSFVYFPKSNVLHMGDCFFNGKFPFIDLSSDGSIDGVIAAVELAHLMTDKETQIIPGHGAIGTKQDLTDYSLMLNAMRNGVKELMKNGKSLEQIKVSSIGEGFESFDGGFIKKEKFVDFIWTSLTKEGGE